ncbi:MAG: Na+/H+ antiporter NhaA [Bacteroidaceae bacterium]|nr:Na+/H+ antiporter NhaA [Bacteroidaceae bacterium]
MSLYYSFKSMLKKYTNASTVLIMCSVAALILANSPIKEQFLAFWQSNMSLSVGEFNLFSHNGHDMTLAQVINDFLMALFFLSVGLEIKRELLVGELSSTKKAMLPIIGALGGMIIPVLLFYITCPDNADMQRGMAIPMATDIAFSLGVLSLFGTRVSSGLKIFLAALAVADDLGGIIVIALFYSSEIAINYLLFAIVCIAILIVGNMRKIMKKRFYLIIGLALWYAMLNSGIHATIAGVVIAFCVPASLRKNSSRYIDRIKENINQLNAIETTGKYNTSILSKLEINKLKSIESAADKLISPLQDLEDKLTPIIGYFVIPLFALANVGIDLSAMDMGSLFNGVGMAVVIGLVVGKFVGVFSFSWVAIKLKIVRLPKGADWKSFAAVCMLCGIGLTVSIFIADLSYAAIEGTSLLNEAKLGILCGSIISAILGCILLNKYLPKEK